MIFHGLSTQICNPFSPRLLPGYQLNRRTCLKLKGRSTDKPYLHDFKNTTVFRIFRYMWTHVYLMVSDTVVSRVIFLQLCSKNFDACDFWHSRVPSCLLQLCSESFDACFLAQSCPELFVTTVFRIFRYLWPHVYITRVCLCLKAQHDVFWTQPKWIMQLLATPANEADIPKDFT